MSFLTHKASMKDYCKALKGLEAPTHTQARLCEILEHLYEHCHHFEKSVSTSTPFYDEFFHQLQGQATHQEECFALLECMIMFCRERQLQMKDVELLPDPERHLLSFYEQSHHWHKEDETLLHFWYWENLPQRYDAVIEQS